MITYTRAINRDGHLKNHAFLMDRAGGWWLAPAFDLSFSRGPGGEHTLLVGGVGRRPGRAQFERVATKAGIKPKRVAEIIGEVDEFIAKWPTFAEDAEDAEVPPATQNAIMEAMTAARIW